MATHNGIITKIGTNRGGAGNYIVVTNGNIRTRYLHLDGDPAKDYEEGQSVEEGQEIGKMGKSGTTNPHLHYEIQVYLDGGWQDLNPVVGDQQKVENFTDPVDLKDPQKIIDDRDGVTLLNSVWKRFQAWFTKKSESEEDGKSNNQD